MSKFVRSSKYRHVFGTAQKKENSYDGVKVSRSAWDSNKVKANPKYVGVQWESGGGGAVAVMNVEKVGKQSPNMPLLAGHKGGVLDMDFSPHNDQLISTVSEDTTVKLWMIPEGGLTESMTEAAQTLTAHRKKVGTADFNPVAANVLATSSTDNCVKVWDVEAGKEIHSNSESYGDNIQSCSWNYNGSLLAVSCKDKIMRVTDPRTADIAGQTESHAGVKGFRVCFMGKPAERIFTCGFNKTSERQYALWDPRDLSKALTTAAIDNASGMNMPFYDNDTGVLFLAGKGDGNVRYYEVAEDQIFYLSEFKSSSSQNGMGYMPKRGCDTTKCEIARLYKATSNVIEPIPMCVPRKGDQFQDDLYPDTASHEAALTGADWASGKDVDGPKLISMEPGKANLGSGAVSFSAKAEESVASLKARISELEKQLAEKDARIAELEK
jgi:coronin-1B/1C/6